MLLSAYSPSVLDSIVAQFLGGTEFHCFSTLRDTEHGSCFWVMWAMGMAGLQPAFPIHWYRIKLL